MYKKNKYSRFARRWYNKPKEPQLDKKSFAIVSLTGTSERYTHFPNDEHYYDYIDSEESEFPEFAGKLPYNQSISLEEVNSLVKENNLDEKNVFFTVYFSEDYLCLQAVHIKELSEQEKLEQYSAQCEEWENQQKIEDQRELERLKQEIISLQGRAEILAKKKI